MVDWITISLYAFMIIAGWLSICGASHDFDSAGLFNPSGRPGSQLIWLSFSVAIIFIVMMLDSNFYDVFAYVFYVVTLVVLLATIFVAPDIKGSYSWLVIGPFRIQPAEFAKFATALALARFMSEYGFKLITIRNLVLTILIIFLPMVLILLQKETGTALVFLAFFLVLYREGMSGYILLAGFCTVLYFVTGIKYADEMMGITPLGELIVSCIILAITIILTAISSKDRHPALVLSGGTLSCFLLALAGSFIFPVNFAMVAMGIIGLAVLYLIYFSLKKWVWHYVLIALFALASLAFLFSVDYMFDKMLEPHQQIRIRVSLGLEDDPSGAGYNVNQSMIAIGSGGLTGKGFLNGTQTKLNYVPEQDTDFIFCTVGEEQGFMGTVGVLILYAVFIIRLILLAERQNNAFGRVYGYSVASVFIFHIGINIGMVLGLTPVIGIPLPFFSYGGSSLLGFTILLFIFLRIDASRKER
jgi:rod shape determining protein RodA